MPVHARPHLNTHHRDKGHSAVAAAAYRLGLRLRDVRTDTWHDYSKRAAGEEVVAAFTLAPEGAPPWATDPHELWNRVEACERRSDSQIARDYRVPVPLGLDDTRARELAQRLAEYISRELCTPVSIGLHRDAETDVFGEVKPPEKQGYHAHLLFPTRPILLDGEERVSKDAAGELGFGPKLSALSNRRTSSGIVEQMNRHWAALANELAAAAGLAVTYDYRSYERLGIDRIPQPTLGAPATAMERQGVFTRRGDAAREIIVMSKVYEQANVEALTAQRAQAAADAVRERQAHPKKVAVAKPAAVAAGAAVDGSDPEGLAEDLAAARERGQAEGAAWADRFIAHAAVPKTAPERQRLYMLSGLVWAIQRSLKALGEVTAKLTGHRQEISRLQAACSRDLVQRDEAKRHLRRAQQRIETWSQAHPWRLRLSSNRPAELVKLDREVELEQRIIHDMTVADQEASKDLARWKIEEAELVEQHDRAESKFTSAVQAFGVQGMSEAPALLAALPEEARARVGALLPVQEPEPKAPPAAASEEPLAPPTLTPGRPRPRPAP